MVRYRWIESTTVVPVSFKQLVLPDIQPPHTPLLDLQPLVYDICINVQYGGLLLRQIIHSLCCFLARVCAS